MPTLVADANLPAMGTEGFFNELETDVVATITAGGTGCYKLTQEAGRGLFTAAELVTEIPDDAVLVEAGDRYELVGEDQVLLFVHFSV